MHSLFSFFFGEFFLVLISGRDSYDASALDVSVGVEPDSADTDDVDKTGNNWMAITDHVLLKCTNLDGLIKKRGDVTEDEKLRWESLGCEQRLKELYVMWQKHSDATKGRCEDLREASGIEVGVDWGFASASVKRKWKELMCDCHYAAGWSDSCLHGKPPTVHSTTTAAGIELAVAARPQNEKLVSNVPAPAQSRFKQFMGAAGAGAAGGVGVGVPFEPVIAIVLGTTSRGFRWSKINESPLVKILLASLERTLEVGFEYRVYVGFDAGDLFYDDDARRGEIARWFEKHVQKPAGKRGITARFATLKFLNVLRKPGPIFNFLTAAAFADGSDFVYRINDDTEFRTPFAAALTTALKNFEPPYLGVVGPTCADGNKKILTHDFVHRTHRQIFQTYYPVVLTDWWMDDWISKVYPRGSYGRHASVAVSHHTWMTGSGNPVRYEVDHGHKQYLDAELRRGAQLVGQFAMNHCRKGACNQPDGHVTPEWKGVYDPANQTVFESVMRDTPSYDYGEDDYASFTSSSSSSSSSSLSGGVSGGDSASAGGSDSEEEGEDDSEGVLDGSGMAGGLGRDDPDDWSESDTDTTVW